ncbi:PREDICTED: protein FAM221B isoform X3 [Rhinopithecus bieti]|uniref:protein FAM221B isoform X3 n=1 Tax=Rhinopithecus bieti TaxID=61621 RepID=UPI00083C6FDB|nr:PREDICTED: protein FAM221B isoform X3 [Rhinopithecus bieti]
MEADEITEEPHTTMDAEEHPLSKDPSAEDLQENRISESFLEPSTSETPLEPHTSESPLVPSPSQIPLQAYSPETHQEPSISETPSGTPTYEASLDSPISVVPEKHLTLPPQSRNYVSLSSSDTLKEDLSSEFSSNEVPWTRRSTHLSESESLPEHSPSGPSAQVQMDASEKQEEEAGEVGKGVDASDSTDHTAQLGHQLGKKKKKKGVSCLYIGWRCPHYLWDCFRIGDESRCFCGHLLREHRIISDVSVPCKVSQCRCLMFCFIPSRPEEVGEFWLKRRATFDPKAWRAQCCCKHSHEEHAATGSHPCRHHGCCCGCFESNFLCAACDRRWEEHETFFETQRTRRRGGRPHGADYVPFAEMSVLREAILSNSDFEALQIQGPSGLPSSHPSPPGLPASHNLQPGLPSDPHT